MEKLLKLLKDIVIIVGCVAISYFVLNNNYVRPHIVKNVSDFNSNTDTIDTKNNINHNSRDQSNWHIYKKEHKILMGISGHTFLELTNSKDETVEQIHGFAYDVVNNKMIESAIKSGFKLKVFDFDYDFYKYNIKNNEKINSDIDTSSFSAIELISDNSTSTLEIWNKAKACGEIINQKDINYPRYGFKIISETENSNSVAHSIALCAGLTDTQIGLISPGARTLLISQ